MESAIAFLLAAIICVGLAAVLGYLIQKWLGVIILVFLALVALVLCMIGVELGYYFPESVPGVWIGLILGILLAGVVWLVGLRLLTKAKSSGRFAASAWYSFAALSIFGYLAGNWIGLLTLTLPAYLLFWWGLYYVAPKILPLRNPKDKADRHKAFRALVTFNMGTNYPYYFVDQFSQPEKRVEGNPSLTLFAGPGFVFTDCDHAAYVTNGIAPRGVFEPGLTFTGMFEEPRIFDLRPQLRAFPVEASTKDGIPIEVVTFIPFRIYSGNKTPEKGKSFPFRKKAVYALLNHELVERQQDKKQGSKKNGWAGGPNDGLIPLIGRPIVQDIISRYTIDELCAPLDPERDPRVEIAAKMRDRVREKLEPLGIYLIGGGISNLVPKNEGILKRRLENWGTRLAGERMRYVSEAQSSRTYQTEKARAEAEVEIVKQFREKFKGSSKLKLALALRFIDTLGDIFSKNGQWPLLNDQFEDQLHELRGETVEQKNSERSESRMNGKSNGQGGD